MELDEIARSLEEIRLDILREVNAFERRDAGPHWLKDRINDACVRIYAVGRMLDDLADATAPGATVEGEGFVVLPVGRFDELREAEEHLQETRFAPSDGEADEKQATIDALTRRLDELADSNRGLVRALDGRGRYIREQAAEIGRLKEAAKVRAEAAAPIKPAGLGTTAGEPRLHPVLDKHLQDIQAEIDGIKDRINAFAARLNRLEADVMPIRRIGPVTGPEDQQRDEATRDRLLQEIKRAAGGVESSKP